MTLPVTGPTGIQSISVSTQEVDLVLWLQSVVYHTNNFSEEDQQSLLELANNLPNPDQAPQEVQELLVKLRDVVEKRKYDRELSPNSIKILMGLLQQIARLQEPERHTTKTRRKLDFEF